MKVFLTVGAVALALLLSSAASAEHRRHDRHHSFYHSTKHHHKHYHKHYYPHWKRERHYSYLGFYIGPSLYYYADHHYYRRHPRTREYIVIDKPHGADRVLQAAAREEMYVYPNRGQSVEQQDRDRYDCHLWATEQSGVDPSLTDAGAEQILDYRRAGSACLEGRGYTVK